MTPVTDRSLGLLIAYVLPGYAAVALWAPLVPEASELLYGNSPAGPSVGGFLYATLAAVWMGLVLSTLRWAILDQVHHLTGISQPTWHIARSTATVEAYRLAVELHYRYYQFYGSMLLVMLSVALYPSTATYGVLMTKLSVRLVLAFVTLLFFFASRDTLRKYYARCQALATTDSDVPLPQGNLTMTNGGAHGLHTGSSPTASPPPLEGEATHECDETTKQESAQTDSKMEEGDN